MAARNVGVILVISASVSAIASDQILSRSEPGLRYQYMCGPHGYELVDLWLKASDVLASSLYNPDENNGYHLYTRANPSNSQPLSLGYDSILQSSNFNASRRTVVLVHGWRNKPLSDFNVQLVSAYLIAEDVNLIMVDWSIGADVSYMAALSNSIRSGEHVATFIVWLNSVSNASLNDYHLIGHSLGAHQSGIIGRHLGGEIAYISALDPALPGWIKHPSAFRSTDGVYTEVIHTDAGFSGLVAAVGHVDFYPNGGIKMPGCSDNNCGHHRCIFYLAESLLTGGFTGTRCNFLTSALSGNCTSSERLKMGGKIAKTGSTGLYLLQTNSRAPYSRG